MMQRYKRISLKHANEKKNVKKQFCRRGRPLLLRQRFCPSNVMKVGEGGLEPPNGFPDRFTVCCNCHYATPPELTEPVDGLEPPTG